MSAILGKKLGMTQIFREDGELVPVTVIEAGPCPVTGIRKQDRDGYEAIQLAFDEVKESKLTKAELGHLAKADAKPMRVVRAPGSIGASAYPARVFKGMKLPGQMGNKRITTLGLEIADVDTENNLLLIKGSVPGHRNSIVEIRNDG